SRAHLAPRQNVLRRIAEDGARADEGLFVPHAHPAARRLRRAANDLACATLRDIERPRQFRRARFEQMRGRARVNLGEREALPANSRAGFGDRLDEQSPGLLDPRTGSEFDFLHGASFAPASVFPEKRAPEGAKAGVRAFGCAWEETSATEAIAELQTD